MRFGDVVVVVLVGSKLKPTVNRGSLAKVKQIKRGLRANLYSRYAVEPVCT